MKQQWLLWQQKFEELAYREKLIVAFVSVFATAWLIHFFMLAPVLDNRQAYQKKISTLQSTVDSLSTQNKQLKGSGGMTALQTRQQLERDALQVNLEKLNQQIESSVAQMVSPQKMALMLESLLKDYGSLKLISLENLPAVAVSSNSSTPAHALTNSDQTLNSAQAERNNTQLANPELGMPSTGLPQSETPVLYQHTFTLTFEGSYSVTLDYLTRLSGLPWQFQWDSLDYEVQQHPIATITLNVQTLSLSKEWIGV